MKPDTNSVLDRAKELDPTGNNFLAAKSRAERQLRFEHSHPRIAKFRKLFGKPPYHPLRTPETLQAATSVTER